MITSTGADAVTPGTVIACWIDPEGPTETRVTVVTMRRYQLSLFTKGPSTGGSRRPWRS